MSGFQGLWIRDNIPIFLENKLTIAINNMKVNKTLGLDKISPRLLKETKNKSVKSFSIISNKSLTLGKVPREWKLANITPIYKKGIKSHPGN